MRLKALHVTNYKTVKDSTSFEVDWNVTCLVGKNQSGKSATFEALEKLNPVDVTKGSFEPVAHYPRHELIRYQRGELETPAQVLLTTWTLEDADKRAISQVVGDDAVADFNEVAVAKGYDNVLAWSFACDEHKVIAHLLGLSWPASQGATPTALSNDEKEPLKNARTVTELLTILAAIPEAASRQKALSTHITGTFGKQSAKDKLTDVLKGRLPKIAYFAEYYSLPGEVSVADLKSAVQKEKEKPLDQKYKMFRALLDMVNHTAEELEQVNKHEQLMASLEAAQNDLSRTIFKYWKQNRRLKVVFRFEEGLTGDPPPFNSGKIFRTRIENQRHGVTTLFDKQSTGFQWFFSFLVWFKQVKKNYGDNVLLLLDEPGLSLHAKAQEDLLEFIEKELAPKHQVLYNAHSPFMVDPKHWERVRTVEDVVVKNPADPELEEHLGTKIGKNFLSTDRDTVFPLQACLGYSITQSLFIGEHTLLVEGPSEILYLDWFSRRLRNAGRTGLDPRWTVCPSGGIDKVPAFMSLFYGNKLHIAVLTDYAAGQKKKIRHLQESALLKEGHVFTMDEVAGQAEADVEDVVGREMYAQLVTDTYELRPEHRLPAARPSGAPSRVVVEVEEHFRALPPEVEEFDHFRPSDFLLRQGASYTPPGLANALERFEKLFTRLNGLLP